MNFLTMTKEYLLEKLHRMTPNYYSAKKIAYDEVYFKDDEGVRYFVYAHILYSNRIRRFATKTKQCILRMIIEGQEYVQLNNNEELCNVFLDMLDNYDKNIDFKFNVWK